MKPNQRTSREDVLFILFQLLLQVVKLRGGEKLPRVIPRPSQMSLMVSSFGFRLFPYRMFLMLDGGSALTVASRLMVMSCSWQRRRMRSRTASLVFMLHLPDFFL